MEEDKNIKLKRRLHMISNIFSYTIIAILMIIGSFLVFYVIDGKICKSKGKNPLFGLYTIISPSMTGTINVYDVAFVKRVNTNDLKKGDIITFYSENTFFGGTPITHRIINVTESSETGRLFTVKGDANPKEDDEKVKAAAESFADFAKKGYFSKNIATNKYPAGQNQEFAPGNAAIVICGSWLPNEAKDSVADDLEWGYFNYPSVPDGKDDNTANNIANQVLAINKNSKMSDEAFKLIEYITTGEFDKKMTEKALCIPTDKANADAWPTELSGVKEAFDATTTYYDWAAGVESNNDITPVLQENTQKLASGKLDAAGFIKAMKEAAGQ